MHKVILIGTALIFASNVARAEFAIAGHGANACAKFAEDYRVAPEVAEITYMTWAQGFMSGLNLNADKEKRRDLSALKIDDQIRQLRHYCDAHPLREFLYAAVDLYTQFPFVRP